MVDNLIPEELESLITSRLGNDADIVLEEIKNTVKSSSVLPPLFDKGKTKGDWNTFALTDKNKINDYRPNDALSMDVIKQMLKSSPVRFALEMKRAQIVSVFRNDRSWKVECSDDELRDVVRANLKQILPKMALDFSFSSLAYGASFQELVWEYKTLQELGVEKPKLPAKDKPVDDKPIDNTKKLEQSTESGSKYVVAKIPNSINPATVKEILRTKEGHFNGFVQQVDGLSYEDIKVEKDSALIIPYEEKFRNLWGESILKPMYPIWYWYEIVLRAMVKYMERTGTPVAMVKAPARATIIKPGTKERIDGITWGMEIASNVARSNAVVIPSDKDEQGNALWELQYLNSTERSQPFLDILELLTQMILRAGLSADRALSQSSGGVGSYSIGEVHKEATALHNELILTQWVHYLNTYFLPLYSLYNRGKNGPSIWLETQGLDPTDRTNLTTLLGVSQQMESFKDIGYRIDWESLLTVNNIPLKSQEEADAHKQKAEQEALKKQEDMLGMQSKFSTPSPTKQPDGSLKANMPNKPATDKKVDTTKKLEEQLDLANPYHDENGRFTSKSGRKATAIGSGGGSNEVVSKEVEPIGMPVEQYKSALQSIPDDISDQFSTPEGYLTKASGIANRVGGSVYSSTIGNVVKSAGYVVGIPLAQSAATLAVSTYTNQDTDELNPQVTGAVIGTPIAVISANIGKDMAKKSLYAAFTGKTGHGFLTSLPYVGNVFKALHIASIGAEVIAATGASVYGIYHWEYMQNLLKAGLPDSYVEFKHDPVGFLLDKFEVNAADYIYTNMVKDKETITYENYFEDESLGLYSLIYPSILSVAIGNDKAFGIFTDAKYIVDNVPGFKLVDGNKAIIEREGAIEFIRAWKNNTLPLIKNKSSVRLESNNDSINLFNPYHDDMGQFASSKGLSEGSTEYNALIQSSRGHTVTKAKGSVGKTVKTTAKILGLTTITGIVGTVALVGAKIALKTKDLNLLGQSIEHEENKLALKQEQLNQLISTWPSFNNDREALDFTINKFKELGFEMPIGVKIEKERVAGSMGSGLRVPAGAAGFYDKNSNTLVIRDEFATEVQSGDPVAMYILAHELGHSNQEFDGEGDFDFGDGNGEYEKFTDIFEGQNDLATLMVVSNIYKKPTLNNDIIIDHTDAINLRRDIRQIEDRISMLRDGQGAVVNITNLDENKITSIGYQEEASTYAGLVTAYADKTNSNRNEVFRQLHSEGFNPERTLEVLDTVFPSEMRENHYKEEKSGGLFGFGATTKVRRTFPTVSEINKWMDNHGYIDRQAAIDQMLSEASR